MENESAPDAEPPSSRGEPTRDPGPLGPLRGWRQLLRLGRRHRGWTLFAGLALFLVLALGLADVLLAAPLRGWAERAMNSSLKGYSVRIARFRPHIWRLGFDL